MKRTQLYLDDDLWQALHARARHEKTTVSDLVRQAARQKYLGNADERRKAMMAIVGLQKNRREFDDPVKYVRELRRDSRLETLQDK